MSGEVVVAGLVTGTHLIEDIGVTVPHQVAVRIPAEVALKSKDLWRGIQQNRLFRLNAGSGLNIAAEVHAPPPSPPVLQQENQRLHFEVQRLQQENQRLQQENQRLVGELAAERQRNDSLQAALVGLTSGLQGVQTAIGKLETAPRVVMAGPGAVNVGGSDVVGGDVPTFVPDKILPENVEAQIRPDKATAERSNVASAASRLRELKRGGG